MFLWVNRHAIAFPRTDPDCPPDPERPLTEKGTRRMVDAAYGLRALGVAPECILASPALRSVETAEIIAQVLRVPEVEVTTSLEADQDPMVLLAELGTQPTTDTLVCGHAPHVDRLIARVANAPRVFSALKKGGTACLEFPDGPAAPGVVHWLLTPKQLRRLANG